MDEYVNTVHITIYIEATFDSSTPTRAQLLKLGAPSLLMTS